MAAKHRMTAGAPGRRNIMSGMLAAVALVGLSAGLPQPLGAQELEEIVVTARKREESLQQIPIAVTAFDAEALAALSASDLAALGSFTPNLNLAYSQGNSGGSNLGATIRGVGQFDYLVTTDPGVGVYLDGIYLGRTTGAVLDLLDVERVEVLRGPQGTLFGKNTIGGAINVVTRRPADSLDGEARLVVGDESRTDARLSVSGPLADNLAASLALGINNRDGYVERADGIDLGDVDQRIARAALSFAPSDRVDLLFAADHTRQRQNSAPSLLAEVNPGGSVLGLWNAFVADPAPIAAADVDIDSNFFSTSQTGTNRNDLDVTGLSVTVDVDLTPGLQLRSITGWRDMEAVFGRDGDNTAAQYVHTQNTVNQDQLSQELQLIGEGERARWLAGVYYFSEDASDFNRPRLGSGLFDALEALPAPLGPPGAACAAPFVAPGCPGNPINVALDLDLNVSTAQEVTSLAVFGNLDYALNDRWAVNIGLRWTDEEKDFFVSSFRENSGAIILPPGTTAGDSWSELSWRLGLDFRPGDEMMYYAALSRGFKSGGFNGRPTAAFAVDSYDPEFITAYEIGVKSDLLDNR
ncbi:MAG: TonB-dependent receptor, partial [Pseudomonadota bacterium]